MSVLATISATLPTFPITFVMRRSSGFSVKISKVHPRLASADDPKRTGSALRDSCQIGIALFAGAYQAEVIRGGLQAIPRGQSEAASALGLSWWKTTALIVMPQALRHVIPGLVNSFIALFKDTSLVLIVALFDLLGQLRASFSDPVWATPTTLFTGFAFTGMIYFVFYFGMSRYSLFVEHRLNAHRRS